jgi:hypothetical protein
MMRGLFRKLAFGWFLNVIAAPSEASSVLFRLVNDEGPDLFDRPFPSFSTNRFSDLLAGFRWEVFEHVVDVAIHHFGVFGIV